MGMTVNGMRRESISFQVSVDLADLYNALRNTILPSVGTKDIGNLDGIRENDIEIYACGWLVAQRWKQWLVHIYVNEIDEGLCEVQIVAIANKLFHVIKYYGSGSMIGLGRSIAKRDEIANAIKALEK